MAEWTHVHHLGEISDGEPTCIPPVHTAVDFEGRAIDLALLDTSSVPTHRRGEIGSVSSDQSPTFITLGGAFPLIHPERPMRKYDFNNADWDRYRDGVRRKLTEFRPTGNLTTDVKNSTPIIIPIANSAITQTNPMGATLHFPPPEAKATQRERDAEYAKYRTTGGTDTLRKIGALPNSITESVNGSRERSGGILSKYRLPY